MAIVVFDIPIPVVVDENGVKKEGYALYVKGDLWCVLMEGYGTTIFVNSKSID